MIRWLIHTAFSLAIDTVLGLVIFLVVVFFLLRKIWK